MKRSAWANCCLTNEEGTDRPSRNVGKQLPTLCNIPEKRRPQLHRGGSLKPRIIWVKQHSPCRLSRSTAQVLPGVVDVRGVRGVPGTSSSLSPTSSFHDTDRSWAGAAFLGDTTMARSAVPFMLVTWHVRLPAKYWAQRSWTNLPPPLTAYVTADAIDTWRNQSRSSHYSDYSSFLLSLIFSIGFKLIGHLPHPIQ